MKKQLSVILPVFNVEKYLEECVGSILNQADDECEIILVDDGSTDQSGRICDGLAGKSPLIRVLHRENQGPSASRNAGIEMAEGEYIAFIDSDDRIAGGALTAIKEWILSGGADICFMRAIKFFPDGTTVDMGDGICPDAIRRKSRLEVFEHLASRPKYPGSACTKIFRRSLLIQNELRFPDARKTGEDLTFVLECLLKAETFDVLEIPYYEYRQKRQGSLSSTITETGFFDLLGFVMDECSKLSTAGRPNDSVSERALSFIAYEYSILIWMYAGLERSVKKKARPLLTKHKWLLRYGKSMKMKAIRLMCTSMGIEITSKLLSAYMCCRRAG